MYWDLSCQCTDCCVAIRTVLPSDGNAQRRQENCSSSLKNNVLEDPRGRSDRNSLLRTPTHTLREPIQCTLKGAGYQRGNQADVDRIGAFSWRGAFTKGVRLLIVLRCSTQTKYMVLHQVKDDIYLGALSQRIKPSARRERRNQEYIVESTALQGALCKRSQFRGTSLFSAAVIGLIAFNKSGKAPTCRSLYIVRGCPARWSKIHVTGRKSPTMTTKTNPIGGHRQRSSDEKLKHCIYRKSVHVVYLDPIPRHVLATNTSISTANLFVDRHYLPKLNTKHAIPLAVIKAVFVAPVGKAFSSSNIRIIINQNNLSCIPGRTAPSPLKKVEH